MLTSGALALRSSLLSHILLSVSHPVVCPTDLNYLFGVFSGIMFTSTFYLFVYSIATGNRPKVYPKVIFPGLVSGLLWGIAMGMGSLWDCYSQ